MTVLIYILAIIGAISLLGMCAGLVKKTVKSCADKKPQEPAPVQQPAVHVEDDESELIAAVMAAAAMMCEEYEVIRKIVRITPQRYENREKPIMTYSYTFAEA